MFTRHYACWPPGLPKTLSVPRTSLYFNLQVSAARYPDKTAIHYYGADISYARLDAEARALAGFLAQRCHVRRGDRVLLYAQNSPQFVIGYYAILRADAAVVPVNPMSRTEELRHTVADSGASTLLSLEDQWREIEPLLGSAGKANGLRHCVLGAYSDYIDAATDIPLPDFVRAPPAAVGRSAGVVSWLHAIGLQLEPGKHLAGPEDLCVMPYTSGTTGKPKGCMHTHSTVLATSTASALWRAFNSESVALGVLPMFHVTGMQANMNTPIQLGCKVVIMSRWDRDAAGLLIERHKITSMTGITTMLVDFLANPDLAKYDLSSLAYLGGGGSAMPEAVAQKLMEVTGLEFVEGYGLSETIAPTHINPPHRAKRQCAGIPIFEVDSRVLNPETFRECSVGEVGEIVIQGPQVFKGYWNQPKATEEAFIEHDGKKFFRTGDLGYYDEEGYFFITDRLKRMINASGFKVWPAEVEAMLYAHPGIQEACVIGTQDAYRGESVKALIVLKPAAIGKVRPEDIVAWARERMAAFKYPRAVEFVDALPKTDTGKVFWRRLQEDENARAAKPAAC